MRILIAEQDRALGVFLQRAFAAENYEVALATSNAIQMAEGQDYDAAILDLNLSETSDLETLRNFRSRRETLPILVISARTPSEERAQAFDMGADDLIVKPFSFAELSARLRAMLRRGIRLPDTTLRLEDLELNRVERMVTRAGRKIDLTPKEFSLLEFLMLNTGQRVTRIQIIQHVWNLSSDTMTNVVDVYINYLRKKVDAGSTRRLIHTVRGVGYTLRSEKFIQERAESPSMAEVGR